MSPSANMVAAATRPADAFIAGAWNASADWESARATTAAPGNE